MGDFEAAYLRLQRAGALGARAEQAHARLSACDLCGRRCGFNRAERLGECRTGLQARVASFGPHHGEEDPLRGWNGSGTIFFSRCNLHCVYCQNHDISQEDPGADVSAEALAAIMLRLQAMGCHNINLVSPTHVVPAILAALSVAAGQGLRLPLVYNTGGYDSAETLALLDGIVDIYMPDMKYADDATGRRLSQVAAYPEVNRAAIREMHRQVGDLILDEHGIAERGLLVRHLVLPGGLAGTGEIVRFLAREISPQTYLNLMDQYRPAFHSREHPPLDRRLTAAEYAEAVALARGSGLRRLDGWGG
jgi:putative pyruvate formate lyase activating enzyme